MSPLIQIKQGWGPSDERRAYREFWVEMHPIVTMVVEGSFMHGSTGMRNVTKAEVAERVALCKALVDEMRRDFRWSKQRIRDNLSLALRTKLAGLVPDLDTLGKRASW